MGEIVSKEDFIKLVQESFRDKADGTTVSTRDAELICNGVFKALTKAMEMGKVKIYKFGSFDRGIKPARNGRNPHTGEAIKIPARVFVKFKPSPNLKEILEPVLTGKKAAAPVSKAAPKAAKPAPAAKKPVDKKKPEAKAAATKKQPAKAAKKKG